MTLILTQISKFGIIHATDSNLTSASGNHKGEGRKLFTLDCLKAALTVAGCYSVGGESIETWMAAFIQQHASPGVGSLGAFARTLALALEDQMSKDEKERGIIIHAAGYARSESAFHPEFYHVRNMHDIDPKTGEYRDVTRHFEFGEDFWTRDYLKPNFMEHFQNGAYLLYINGFPSGRIGYMMLQHKMTEFLRRIWSNRNWKFRPPKSLREMEVLVKLYMEFIIALFVMSDYSAPVIGGTPQIHGIPQPENVLTGY